MLEDGSGGGADVLVAGVRIDVEPVEVRVERGQLVRRGALHVDDAELLVPDGLGPLLHVLEGVGRRDLQSEVLLRLLEADQRGGDPHRHGSVGARVEAQVAGDVAPAPSVELSAVRDRGVEGGVDEHPRHAQGVVAAPDVGVAGDRPVGGVQGESTGVGDVVQHEARLVAGVGEPHHRGVVGRRDLRLEAVVEGDAVVVRLRDLVVVAEGQCASSASGCGDAALGGRHDLERLAVTHPRAGLVAEGERLQLRAVLRVVALGVVVQPTRGARVRDGGPEVEPVRDRRRGDVVAPGEAVARVGASGGDDVVRRSGRRGGRLRRAHRDVVDPTAEVGGSRGLVVGHHDPVDRLARGDGADRGDHGVPLVRVEDLRSTLSLRAECPAVLVARLQVAEMSPVGEGKVHGGVRARVGEVAPGELREDLVGELGRRGDREVDVEHLVVGVPAPVGRVGAHVVQGRRAGEPDVRPGVVGVARDPSPPSSSCPRAGSPWSTAATRRAACRRHRRSP